MVSIGGETSSYELDICCVEKVDTLGGVWIHLHNVAKLRNTEK